MFCGLRSSCPEVFCKKGVLGNFANSQKNTGARASFLIKLQASGLQLYWKRDSSTGVFLWILWNFYDQLFLQNSSGGCFCFLSVSLLLPVRFTLSYLPPPLFYSEVLILFLILYLGAVFYKKKKKKRKEKNIYRKS